MSKLSTTVVPPVPKRVFEDKTGRRIRIISALLLICVLTILGFAMEFSMRVYALKPPYLASTEWLETSQANQADISSSNPVTVVMKRSAYTDCGQGIFNISNAQSGVAGFVPFDDATALAGLRAHCSQLDAVYYQALSFGEADGSLRILSATGTGFPLPEFNTGLISRNRPIAFPVLTPLRGVQPESLIQIFTQPDTRSTLMAQLEALDLTGVDGGICIDLKEYSSMSASDIVQILKPMNAWLKPLGIRSCLIGMADAAFWQDQELVSLVGKTVLLGFQTPNSPSSPIAQQDWFDATITLAQQQIPTDKLTFALGSFSTLWKSGQRTPERISFAETMLRTNLYDGIVNYSSENGSSRAQYLDEERRLNQIWVLDAVSYSNQNTAVSDGVQIAVWPLGYEDPAIWDLPRSQASSTTIEQSLETGINISDHVTVEGTGPFSTQRTNAVEGFREVEVSNRDGRVLNQTYVQIPAPHRVGLFGDSDGFDVSITFNGLGSTRETNILLALLSEYQISATFFLSTNDLLLSEPLIRKLVASGHTIGTSTKPRESRSSIPKFFSVIRNNLTQQLLQQKFGHLALFVQNPSRYGQFPGDRAVLDQLQDLQSSGYIPVFSNFDAPYGVFDSSEFVHQIRQTAFENPANILKFDFSDENDNITNLILPDILRMLGNDGFNFTTLPAIASLSPEQVHPVAAISPVLRDKVIFWLMTITWLGVQNFVFLLALIVALRSPIYLILAFMRREKYSYDNTFQPKVTVIIPAYNEAKVINKTLKSVLASDYPKFKIIVVDDGSKDNTGDIVEKAAFGDDRVALIRQENHGKWFAEDRALDAVDSEIFIIVDADTLLHKDAIKYLVQPFCDARVGAVAGTVEVGNRDNLITACQVIEYKISQNVMRRAYEVFNGILVVPGAIGAWRKTAVIESGLVSGDTITEDADLTVAVHRSDYKVIYAPLAKSYTEAPNSVKSFMQQRLRWSLGMLQVSWKHKGAITEGRAVGFVSIVDAVWYRIISSFVFPLVDLIIVTAVASWAYKIATQGSLELNHFSVSVILLFLLLTLLDVVNLAAAFWFERKLEWKLLLLVPFLRFGYRQLLYISSMRSIFHATSGRLRGWQKLSRTDTAKILRK